TAAGMSQKSLPPSTSHEPLLFQSPLDGGFRDRRQQFISLCVGMQAVVGEALPQHAFVVHQGRVVIRNLGLDIRRVTLDPVIEGCYLLQWQALRQFRVHVVTDGSEQAEDY